MNEPKSQKSQGIPDHIVGLLAAADERNGLPPGTMYSIMQQEVGGQRDRFLKDPTAYHYEAGPDGRRVAKHTGKVSTAFGPFGILESTAAKPGFGVAPLKDKSIEEQVRFAGDYLAARSKKGGLKAGLAGYGEGEKYANQVAGRIKGGVLGSQPAPQAPVLVAPVAAPQVEFAQRANPPVGGEPVTEIQAQPVQVAAVPAQAAGPDPWQEFLAQSQMAQVQPADLAYGPKTPARPAMVIPDFAAAVASSGQQMPPSFATMRPMRVRV